MTLTQAALITAIVAIVYLKWRLNTAEKVADWMVIAAEKIAHGTVSVTLDANGDIRFNNIKRS